MCGIVGVAGPLGHEHMKMFKDLLLMDVVRGEDSTGVLQVDEGRSSYDIARCSGHPCNLWDKVTKDSLFNWDGLVAYKSRILLGHNRYTTSGNSWVEDPHPFDFENVCGVHNGTLTSTYDLHNEKEYDIDSEALYSEINHNGIESAWEKLWGAAALVFWDKRDDTINLIRNSERSLYLLHDEEKGILYWASEAWMLNGVIHRSKTILHPSVNKEGKKEPKLPIYLTEDTLYKFKSDIKTNRVTFEGQTKLKKRQWGYGTNGSAVGVYRKPVENYSPFKSNDISPSMRINMGWADNEMKADKSFRGDRIYLTYNFSRFVNKHEQFIIAGRIMSTGEKVLIFPGTHGEYWDIADTIVQAKSKFGKTISDPVLQANLASRPRVLSGETDAFTQNTTGLVLGIQSCNVRFTDEFEDLMNDIKVSALNPPSPKYPLNNPEVDDGWEDNPNLRSFQEKLCDAGQCCIYCGEVFDLHKPDEVRWVDDYTPMCIPCYDNGKDFENKYYGAC